MGLQLKSLRILRWIKIITKYIETGEVFLSASKLFRATYSPGRPAHKHGDSWIRTLTVSCLLARTAVSLLINEKSRGPLVVYCPQSVLLHGMFRLAKNAKLVWLSAMRRFPETSKFP